MIGRYALVCDGLNDCVTAWTQSHLAWGSVADWVLTVAAILAFYFTRKQLTQGKEQLQQGLAALEHQRGEQARGVILELKETHSTPFVDGRGRDFISVHVRYWVTNNSASTITDLQLAVTNFEKYADVLGPGEAERCGPRERRHLLAGQLWPFDFTAEIFDKAAGEEFDLDENLRAVLTFTDATGGKWQLDQDNQLNPLPR